MGALHRCVKKDKDDPVREFMWSALEAKEELQRQSERVKGLESRCARVTAGYGQVAVGRSADPEELWAKLADEKETEAQLAQKAQACREVVEEVLEKMERPLDREALRLRYMEGLTWPDVQVRLMKQGFTTGLGSLPRVNQRALMEAGRLAGIL